MTQKYGNYSWICPYCNQLIKKDTPQGLGIAKSNHLRKHGINTSLAKADHDFFKAGKRIQKEGENKKKLWEIANTLHTNIPEAEKLSKISAILTRKKKV